MHAKQFVDTIKLKYLVFYFRHLKIMKIKQHIPLMSTFEGETMPFLHMMPVLYTKVRGKFIW